VSSDFDPNLANKAMILRQLRQLSSRSEQERLWLSEGGGRDVGSFVEAVCGLFDDSGFSDIIREKRPTGLGVAAERALLEIGAVTDTIDWKIDERAKIDSKEMETVRHLAAVALRLIESTSDD
jgi:hypothetical protein